MDSKLLHHHRRTPTLYLALLISVFFGHATDALAQASDSTVSNPSFQPDPTHVPRVGSRTAGPADNVADDDYDDDDCDDSDTSMKVGSAQTPAEDEDADDSDPADQGKALSANMTLATDYILRGLSQTDHQPATQGGFDWEHPLGLYLGVWGSNVRFTGLPESLELDFYGGYTRHFSDKTSLSLGALYGSYWAGGDRNTWTIPLKGQWTAFSLEVDYSPRWEGQATQDWYLQGGWQDKVVWDVKLGAFIGESLFTAADEPNYADFLVSAAREFFGVEWKITGVFVNTMIVNSAQGGDRAIFSVSKTF